LLDSPKNDILINTLDVKYKLHLAVQYLMVIVKNEVKSTTFGFEYQMVEISFVVQIMTLISSSTDLNKR
jgi:hypothetical protein